MAVRLLDSQITIMNLLITIKNSHVRVDMSGYTKPVPRWQPLAQGL